MSNIKPININPELFKISNKKNKTSKASSNAIIKPNILRKELLARIKSHRSNKLKQSYNPTTQTTPTTPTTKSPIKIENKSKLNKVENDKDADDFSQSIDFLKSLSKKKQNNLTQKTSFPLEKTIPSVQSSVSSELSSVALIDTSSQMPVNLQKTPAYGCLKNGRLPTFREFKNKTIKKPYDDNPSISLPILNPIIIEPETPQTPQNPDNPDNTLTLVNDLVPVNIDELVTPNVTPNVTVQEKCLTKPKTIKYTLGKRDNIVSVLIKNAHTRKNIVDSIARIKETKITDMKKYLKQHNLLKSGSKCPPDVIKKMYEQSFLCGIIKNNNKDNLIENFLNN